MKTSHHEGLAQPDKAHIAPDHTRVLVVAHAWSTPAPDQADVAPTWDARPEAVGIPPAGALETGSFSAANMHAVAQRGREPSLAVGRPPPPQPWAAYGAPPPAPPPPEASPLVTMADNRRTAIGQAMDRVRQGTVEPVIGLSNDVRGVRPFSVRGVTAAAGQWCRGCWAGHRQRRHGL